MIREAIILAGGFGKRLKEVVSDAPKSMALVNGHPFLTYLLDYLNNWGIQRAILGVGYKHDYIEQHFGDSYKSMQLIYSVEDEPLGTGGAVKKAMERVTVSNVLVFNGDTYFDVNLQRLQDFQRMVQAELIITLKFVDDTSRYGTVKFDEDRHITGFTEKGQEKGPGYINGGVYLINKRFFEDFDLPEKFSLEKDFLEKYYGNNLVYGLRCFSYFIDIGIPQDYQRAQHEFKRFLI